LQQVISAFGIDSGRMTGKPEVIIVWSCNETTLPQQSSVQPSRPPSYADWLPPLAYSPVSVAQEGGSNMQDGSVTVERRKRGPDVWCFRWREGGPDGRKIHRRIVLGTADDLKTIASARKAVVGLRREINLNDVRIKRESITLADLSRHFQQRELVRGNTRIAYSTRRGYEGYLKKWIEPG
jgi:hypothetical protein